MLMEVDFSNVHSLRDLQELTGLSRSTVYRLSREKDFPGFYVGRRLIIDGARLGAWLRKRQEEGIHCERADR